MFCEEKVGFVPVLQITVLQINEGRRSRDERLRSTYQRAAALGRNVRLRSTLSKGRATELLCNNAEAL